MANSPPKFTIFSTFEDAFPKYLSLSVIGKALLDKKWHFETINFREYAKDKHRTIDDSPYGGGAGMVLKAQPLHDALIAKYGSINNVMATDDTKHLICDDEIIDSNMVKQLKPLVIYVSPRGYKFNQQIAMNLANFLQNKNAGFDTKQQCETSNENDRAYGEIALICGRFEGIDQRVLDLWGAIELSIGDYILAGGELAALVMIEAIIRLLPRVLGNNNSIENESFVKNGVISNCLEHNHYTKPSIWQGQNVPSVLLSGNHKEITKWRNDNGQKLMRRYRPDLIKD